jgi:hypothetical protein
MVAAAVIGGSVISAGSSMFGASKAAKAQKKAAAAAAETQKEFFNVTQNNLKPYMAMGEAAIPDATKFDQAALEGTPGYKFALSQGLKAVQNSMSAKLLGGSGAAIKGAASFATGLADQTYGENYNRLLERVRIGQNAAAGVGSAAMQAGSTIGGYQVGAGDAKAAAWNSGATAIGNAAKDIGGYYMTNKLLGL